MTQKKSDGQNAPKLEVKKQEAPKTPVTEKTAEKPKEKPSYEELLAKLEVLEKARLNKPANIQEVIDFYEQKKARINQLAVLKNHKESLINARASTQEAQRNSDFEGQTFKLSFMTNSKYSSEPLFNISNLGIIEDCTEFLIKRIEVKVQQLEAEIKADF